MKKTDQKSLNYPEALNRSYIAPEIARQRLRTIEALDIQVGESILDVGCGTGFLSYEMALIVGQHGSVTAIDPDTGMIEHTIQRCAGLDNVDARTGDAIAIEADDASFNIVTCTQVLLYVSEVEVALSEYLRVLKPGGRLGIIETDWRGVVMRSNYLDLSRKIIDAWDATVASPNLPPRLPHMLRDCGFKTVRSEAIPLLNTSLSPNSFSANSLDWLAKTAYERGVISKEEGKMWANDLEDLGKANDYFFCLNRFLFIAVK